MTSSVPPLIGSRSDQKISNQSIFLVLSPYCFIEPRKKPNQKKKKKLESKSGKKKL